MVEQDAQAKPMEERLLAEGQTTADEIGAALTQSIVQAFDVRSCIRLLGGCGMTVRR